MQTFTRTVTPAQISPSILSLCAQLAPGEIPLYVDVTPIAGAPINECFPLVAERINELGGSAVLGWSIWEWPTLFVEGEFHAVWKTSTGDLVDITPKAASISRILFLPGPNSQYEGRLVRNTRVPIANHRPVLQFIAACEAEYELLNRGDRADRHGMIRLSDAEAKEMQQILSKKMQAGAEMLRLKPTIDAYDPCWCGSGRKVKWCHGTA